MKLSITLGGFLGLALGGLVTFALGGGTAGTGTGTGTGTEVSDGVGATFSPPIETSVRGQQASLAPSAPRPIRPGSDRRGAQAPAQS